MTGDVLGAIRAALPQLSVAEARVAEEILRDPDGGVDLTIAQLADACSTSQATVNRFCQSLGFAGYREFRLELAAATSREAAARQRFDLSESEIDPSDSTAEVATKIAYQETSAIERTARELDVAAIDAAASAISTAHRIDVYGVGASALTAGDLQQKLSRIGLLAAATTDSHLALASSSLLGPGDVAIAVSHTGETLETLRPLTIAAEANATTIAITNFPSSRVARVADHVLTTHARESPYRYGAMSSRIAQLALVDILFVRIAQASPERTTDSLARTYDAVRGRSAR